RNDDAGAPHGGNVQVMTTHKAPLLRAETTKAVLDVFRDVHRGLGFGYREYIYKLAMQRDLQMLGHQVDLEVPYMIYYLCEQIAAEKMDMTVDGKVIVEVKATEKLAPTASTQLFGYLCASDYEVGLLLHFGHEPNFQRVIFENRFKIRDQRSSV